MLQGVTGERLLGPDMASETTKRAWRAGRSLFLLACGALGAAEVAFGRPLAHLDLFGSANGPAPLLMGTCLLGLSALALFRRWTAAATDGLAACWFIATLFAVQAAFRQPAAMLEWVAPSKTILFALGALAVRKGNSGAEWPALRQVLRLMFGVTMMFYGLVHIFHRDLIAGLIPAWIPAQSYWPFLTASVFLLSGAALAHGRFARDASFLIASMFASWLVLLHVERAAAEPRSISEWAFGLSALGLLALALMVGAHAKRSHSPG